MNWVSSQGFQQLADHRGDDGEFKPAQVKEGDIIYVRFWRRFFEQKKHQQINVPYVMLSNFHDASPPGEFECVLERENLLAWFAVNVGLDHPKLHPIPLGTDTGRHRPMREALEANLPRTKLLYMNFGMKKRYKQRQDVLDLFSGKPFVYEASKLKPKEYFRDVASSRFVLCPPGLGMDTFRIWEVLAMGAYPVVKSSALDRLFKNLPVVIVDEWSQVTERFLANNLEAYSGFKWYWKMEKLEMEWWTEQVKQHSRILSSIQTVFAGS